MHAVAKANVELRQLGGNLFLPVPSVFLGERIGEACELTVLMAAGGVLGRIRKPSGHGHGLTCRRGHVADQDPG